MNDELQNELAQAAAQLRDAFTSAAPEAWEATLIAVQIGAIAEIVIGSVVLLLSGGLGYAAMRLFRKGQEAAWEDEEAYYIPAVMLTIVTIGVAIAALSSVLSAENWIAAIDPAAGIAYKIVEGLGK